MGSPFYHSHVHSEFSTGDAILRVEDAAKRAAELNQPALGLTDHGTMAGLVQHYRACRKHGVLPLLGVEAYLVENAQSHPLEVKAATEELNTQARQDGNRKHVTNSAAQASKRRRHCLLWARNFAGYQELTRAMNKAWVQMYYKPLLDHELLADLGSSGNVWMSTGCVSSELPQLVRKQQYEAAEHHLNWYRSIFKDRLVLEVQHHGLLDVDEQEINRWLSEMAIKYGCPLTISGDVHYLNREDKVLHDFFKKMSLKSEDGRGPYQGAGYHLCSVEDYHHGPLSQYLQQATAGFEQILETCKQMSFPPLDSYSYQVPEIVEKDPIKVLTMITLPHLDRLQALHPDRDYRGRYHTELMVIKNTGFAQYFLFVRSIVKFCEENDIFVLARGSASGSLFCFLLGITQLDPLEYDLLFERFLSNDRSKPPDIDLDVEDDRREEVLRYISKRFETTQIGTVLRYQDKSIRNEVAAQMKREVSGLAQVAVEDICELGISQELIEGLRGVVRASGGHPAGVVAETTQLSVRNLVPLKYISSSQRWVTQYDMDDIESLGFVKVDVLGLASLRTVRTILQMLGKRGNDLSWIPMNDAKTWTLLQSGDCDGIFTFKGWSNKKGCQLLRPKSLNDCSLVAAMWRPSCLELGLEQTFLERRKARWKVPADWHPALQELQETFGIAVYQEQVIKIIKHLGFSADEVMGFMKAVKKKDVELMDQVRGRLAELVDPQTFKQVWELAEGYTRYGFNRSHSVAYGLFGYRMAYLKANYPLQFFCATLQTETEKTNQTLYIRNAKKWGIRILTPDVLKSGVSWRVDGKGLRRGLSNVNGVGEKAALEIVTARPFTTIDELRDKSSSLRLNRGHLGFLAKAGALESVGISSTDEVA